MDGDLGPYDVVEVRLRAVDTIIFLDFSFARCAWRTIRRSCERADFWRWLVSIAGKAVRYSWNRSRNTRPMRTFTYFGTRRHSVSSSRKWLGKQGPDNTAIRVRKD
jgi:hypothetical protein